MKIYSQSTSSTVPEVSALRIYGLPRDIAIRPVAIARAGDAVIYLDAEGKLYSARVSFNGSFVFGRGRFDDYVRAAAKLGCITQAMAKKHLADAAARDEERRKDCKVRDFKRQATNLGIALTKTQLRQLEKGA